MQDILSSMDSVVESLAASNMVSDCLDWLNPRLAGLFVADDVNDKNLEEDAVCIVSPKTFVYALLYLYTTILVSIFAYRMRRRSRLKRELNEARAQLKYLQEKLQQQRDDDDHHHKTEVRIFMDGAFDLMHYGHMNAFRLARSLGTHLIVGVNSDESITACKAAPLMNDDERMTMVSSCKFVDEVVPNCPYIMNKEYLDWVMEKYNIDYVVHGDDPCIVDGKDVYAAAKAMGKYRSIPRTEGVSTTDIVGRMLIMTKEHHLQDNHNTRVAEDNTNGNNDTNGESIMSMSNNGGEETQPEQPPQYSLGRQSKFLTTSRMLQLFSSGVKAPAPGTRVVYIDGSWDMFHPGHVSLLRAAKERGDFLIVGVHGDAVVNQMLGMNLRKYECATKNGVELWCQCVLTHSGFCFGNNWIYSAHEFARKSAQRTRLPLCG